MTRTTEGHVEFAAYLIVHAVAAHVVSALHLSGNQVDAGVNHAVVAGRSMERDIVLLFAEHNAHIIPRAFARNGAANDTAAYNQDIRFHTFQSSICKRGNAHGRNLSARKANIVDEAFRTAAPGSEHSSLNNIVPAIQRAFQNDAAVVEARGNAAAETVGKDAIDSFDGRHTKFSRTESRVS
ncbi:hypothetical protein SDC9_100582 [bioreactor metagenome]|uniref:Uncharacterized protein n=1 Tax=bioreactor metagenome TaxID=1076179 RepID=A0A645ASG4_9ZZZZ